MSSSVLISTFFLTSFFFMSAASNIVSSFSTSIGLSGSVAWSIQNVPLSCAGGKCCQWNTRSLRDG
jgi:hypothetical protein